MSDLDKCGVPHPKRSGVFCIMPAHSAELCHSGGDWIWWWPTGAPFGEARYEHAATEGEMVGQELGRAVLAMTAHYRAIADGMRKALRDSMPSSPVEPDDEHDADAPQPPRKPDLLLDRDGDAWVPTGVDGADWRTGGVGEARSREDVEQSYGPVTEYYLGKGPEND